MRASQEYYDQKWLDVYRGHPDILEKDLEEERRYNTFLRGRGATPRKSDLKRYAKLLAQEERDAVGLGSSEPPRDSSSAKLRTSTKSTSQISHTRQAAAEDETESH